MGNLIKDGVVMFVAIAVIIILWIVLSSPFDTIMSNIEDVNMTASDAEVDSTGSFIRGVWDLFWAGLILIPIIWFIFRIYQREPEWRY